MPDLAPTRISTRDLPARDRSAVVREVLGRKVLRLEIENLPDQTYHVDLNIQSLAGIKIVSGRILGGIAHRRARCAATATTTSQWPSATQVGTW